MYCKNCGAQLEENAGFCGNCGTKVEIRKPHVEVTEKAAEKPIEAVTESQDSDAGKKKKKKKGIIIGAVVAVLCLAVAGGIFAYINYFSVDAKYGKYVELGQKYLQEENYEEAIAAFEKAIECEPKTIDARLGIADAYINLDEYKPAIKYLKKVIKIDDKSMDAYLELADAYLGNEERDKAIETLTAAIEIDGEYADAYLKIADIYIESKEYEEAVNILNEGYVATKNSDIKDKIKDTEEKIVKFEVEKEINFSQKIESDANYGYGYDISFSIPKVKDSVPNADKINNKINSGTITYAELYQQFSSGDYSIMDQYGLCEWKVSYEVHQYGNLCALTVTEDYGYPESGGDEYNTAYFYDCVLGDMISAAEYAQKCGYDAEEIISQHNNSPDNYGSSKSDIEDIAFYVDSDGKLEILYSYNM